MLSGVLSADDVSLAALVGGDEGGAHALGPRVGLGDLELLEVQSDGADVLIAFADLEQQEESLAFGHSGYWHERTIGKNNTGDIFFVTT